jgi:hypothetical protein
MASNDSRTHYLRNTIAGFTTLTVPQSFLDNRPLIKTEGDEEKPPTFYTEADGLTFFEAMKLYRPHSVAFYNESAGAPKDNLLCTLADVDTPADIPEVATCVFYGLHDWQPEEQMDAYLQIHKMGLNPRHYVFLWGPQVQDYLQNGIA